MTEPESITLEQLRAIRAEVGELRQQAPDIEQKLDSKAETAQVADVERKLDGLTHVVISGLGSLVRSFEPLDKRVPRLA